MQLSIHPSYTVTPQGDYRPDVAAGFCENELRLGASNLISLEVDDWKIVAPHYLQTVFILFSSPLATAQFLRHILAVFKMNLLCATRVSGS